MEERIQASKSKKCVSEYVLERTRLYQDMRQAHDRAECNLVLNQSDIYRRMSERDAELVRDTRDFLFSKQQEPAQKKSLLLLVSLATIVAAFSPFGQFFFGEETLAGLLAMIADYSLTMDHAGYGLVGLTLLVPIGLPFVAYWLNVRFLARLNSRR